MKDLKHSQIESPTELGYLKNLLKDYFHKDSLTPDQEYALESVLLAHSVPNRSFVTRALIRYKKPLLSHVLAGSLAAAATFGIIRYNENSVLNTTDLISDVDGISDSLKFVPNFNLEGDFTKLPTEITDSIPNHAFSPSIPSQISQNYLAYEGRFFLYQGSPGVGIRIMPSDAKIDPKNTSQRLHDGFKQAIMPSTFYIVKLTEKNRFYFPKQKTLRKIRSSTGKSKRVYAWGDNSYGYAMVQNVAVNESP